MWLGSMVQGSFYRGRPRGKQSLLGLLPAVLNSVAQSSSSPAPPHGLQSPFEACGRWYLAVRIPETEHAESSMAQYSVGPPDVLH